MLYNLESNRHKAIDRSEQAPLGVYNLIDFEGLPERPIKGYSFSDRHIIGWTENTCYVYDKESSATSLLSFQLDLKDSHQFMDILELPDSSRITFRDQLFVITIESSSQSRMIIIWDEKEKQEVSSADTSAKCQILLDQYGLAYVVD